MGTALFAWTGLCVAVAVLGGLGFAVAVEDPPDPFSTGALAFVVISFEMVVLWVWSTVAVGSAAIWFVIRKEEEGP